MLNAGLLAVLLMLPAGVAVAQDVPGIEICNVEKTMERRTSCLQSNVDYLKKTMTKDTLDHQKKIDAANRDLENLKRQVEALKGTVVGLQRSVEQLETLARDRKSKDAPAK